MSYGAIRSSPPHPPQPRTCQRYSYLGPPVMPGQFSSVQVLNQGMESKADIMIKPNCGLNLVSAFANELTMILAVPLALEEQEGFPESLIVFRTNKPVVKVDHVKCDEVVELLVRGKLHNLREVYLGTLAFNDSAFIIIGKSIIYHPSNPLRLFADSEYLEENR